MPVNADVPSIEAILVEERDVHVNALGIKGVGQHQGRGRDRHHGHGGCHRQRGLDATGVRVRSFPITLDRLIEA